MVHLHLSLDVLQAAAKPGAFERILQHFSSPNSLSQGVALQASYNVRHSYTQSAGLILGSSARPNDTAGVHSVRVHAVL